LLIWNGSWPLPTSPENEVREGDRIIYAGSLGEVEFVVTETTGDAALDWYLTHSPDGGFMIQNATMGFVFLDGVDEDPDFVSGAPA
jgi:hypothetical protein